MRICSFDIFDTLVTRRLAKPTDLFFALGQKVTKAGWLKLAPEQFAHERMEAEAQARRAVPNGEANLEEIYDTLAARLGFTEKTKAEIRAMELEVESQNICAVPGMVQRVIAARQAGAQILFISDMYLPANFLLQVLEREGFYQPNDKLYLSHQHRASKASGQLFALIRKEVGNPQQWQHLGDNPVSDFQAPSHQGIEAELYSGASLNRYELLARGSETFTPLWRSHLAASMRAARLDNPEREERLRTIWDSGADVVGPLLFGFVHWCLEKAEAKGIKRLYFVSRDGQILHRIAQVITKAWKYDVECRYLYGSRQAWHVPALDHFSEENLETLIAHASFLSLEQFFSMFSLKALDFHNELASTFPKTTWEQNLDSQRRQDLIRLFLKAEIRSSAESKASHNRKLAIQYLQQEKFLDGVPSAMVDIGWFGNLQKSLSRLIALESFPKALTTLTGFYFGLKLKTISIEGQELIGYWNEFSHPRYPLWRENISMFEMFTSADHGPVIGYEKDGDRVKAALGTQENSFALQWGLRVLQTSILRVCATLTEQLTKNFSQQGFHQIARDNYRRFYYHPSKEEAKTWGEFQLSGQQIERTFQQPVPSWNYAETLAAIPDYRRRPENWWPEGSVVLYGCTPLLWFLKIRALKWRLTDILGALQGATGSVRKDLPSLKH